MRDERESVSERTGRERAETTMIDVSVALAGSRLSLVIRPATQSEKTRSLLALNLSLNTHGCRDTHTDRIHTALSVNRELDKRILYRAARAS